MWKKLGQVIGIGYKLEDLIKTIEEAKTKNDPTIILKFATTVRKFYSDDKSPAIQHIQSAFWSKHDHNQYLFTNLFHQLSASDLCKLLKIEEIYDGNVEKFIFDQNNHDKALSRFKLSDLLEIFHVYYKYEKFAWYIYNKFYKENGFIKYTGNASNARAPFLKNISLKLAFKMLDENTIHHLSTNELIDLFEKIKREKQIKSYNKLILMCITDNLLDKNIEQISIDDFYFLIKGELVTMSGIQKILNTLKQNQKATIILLEKEFHDDIHTIQSECLTASYAIPVKYEWESYEQYANKLCSHLEDICSRYRSLDEEINSARSIVNGIKYINQAIV